MERFIGDLHFGHTNALAYDNRPFLTAEANNEAIIERWNECVNITDHTWILGDISHINVTRTMEILKQLNGSFSICLGNHDEKFLRNRDFRNMFREICYYKKIDLADNKQLILSHYPIMAFDGQFRGNIHLYAHVHNSRQWEMVEMMRQLTEKERGKGTCRMYNVGCMLDYMSYTPRTLDEILEACEGEGSKGILERNIRNDS